MSENQDQQDQLEKLLQEGIDLARTGRRDEARAIFEQIITANPYHETAWLWMTAVARTPAERREALEIVLEINPNNQRAREALNQLGGPRARRKADAARAIADRIGSTDTINEADFQPVLERPAEPEPDTEELTPEEEATELAHAMIRAARSEAEETEQEAVEAVQPVEAELVSYEVVTTEQQPASHTRPALAAAAALLGLAAVVALLASSGLFSQDGAPGPTPNAATRVAMLNTATPTYDGGVLVTALPGRVAQIPASWTPSHTPTATATATPSPTALPPASYRLVFARRQADAAAYSLYTARADGREVERLSTGETDDRAPAPGPDRRRIAYAINSEGTRQIALLDLTAAPEDRTPVPIRRMEARQISAPAWAPDGYRIAFSANVDGDEDIYLTDIEGTSFARLTDNPADDRDPIWSPDGQVIVFASSRDGEGQTELYSMKPNGTDVTALTNSQGSSYQPTWSPDGRYIVFVSDRDRDADLYIMNADGSNERLLTRGDDAEDRDPAWSPDGRWIVFSSNRDSANFRLFLIEPSGEQVIPVTTGDADDLQAAWLLEPRR